MDLKNKTILVTGADGFIGSHLTEMLVKSSCKIRALAQYNSFNYWGWLEDIEGLDDVEVILGDIRDPYCCKKITENIDIIFHLAALIAIPYSYLAPDSYIDTNVKGTLNICQAARENNCERIIHTSTSEVYGTAQYIPIDEKHPIQAQSPYSASKIGADALATSFFNSFNLPLTIARPFNTFGPRQSARAVIPTIISQIASGKTDISLGDTRPTRDFTFVKDTCQGLMRLAKEDKATGEVVNIGSDREISIKDLFNLINGLMGNRGQIIEEKERHRPPDSEVFRLWADNKKLKDLTGFTPAYSLEEGLKQTIDWFTEPANLIKYKSDIFNL